MGFLYNPYAIPIGSDRVAWDFYTIPIRFQQDPSGSHGIFIESLYDPLGSHRIALDPYRIPDHIGADRFRSFAGADMETLHEGGVHTLTQA
eukprot:7141780-Pyramimonas_sp.AAC.1